MTSAEVIRSSLWCLRNMAECCRISLYDTDSMRGSESVKGHAPAGVIKAGLRWSKRRPSCSPRKCGQLQRTRPGVH